MKSYIQLARAAYEAYCKKAIDVDEEGLATHALAWNELDPATQHCWIAVSKKISEELSTVH